MLNVRTMYLMHDGRTEEMQRPECCAAPGTKGKSHGPCCHFGGGTEWGEGGQEWSVYLVGTGTMYRDLGG